MDRDDFVTLLTTMAEGWNESDPDKVAACFAERVYYCDPARYLHTTRGQLREFFKPPEGGEQKTTWQRIIFDEEQQTGAAEYSYEGHYGYHGCVMARVEDGLVTHWREWQHVSDQDWEEFVAGPGKLPLAFRRQVLRRDAEEALARDESPVAGDLSPKGTGVRTRLHR